MMKSDLDFDLLTLLAEDKKQISYRPSFVDMTGSVLSGILLSEIVYWWVRQGKTPFYKFKMPAPNHPKYKVGDSWCEALRFSESEFNRAIRGIGVKIKKGATLPSDAFVWYWTTVDRVTYYRLNEEFVMKRITDFYVTANPRLRNPQMKVTGLDIQPRESRLDKKPLASSNTTTTTGVVFPDALKKHQSQINKLIEDLPKSERQTFLDELAAANENGHIEKGILPYAKGMLQNGWVPSSATQSSQRDSSINQRIADIQDATKEGALILINGQPVTIDGRFVTKGDSTLPLGPLVASELDEKIQFKSKELNHEKNHSINFGSCIASRLICRTYELHRSCCLVCKKNHR